VTNRLFVVVAVLAMSSPSLLGQSKPSIQGVWRPVEVTVTNPNPTYGSLPKGTHTNLQPTLLIFTDKHYSFMADTASKPRPVTPFKVAADPTAEEAIPRWGPFLAHAGMYEISGNVITQRPMVNKASPAQGRGYFERLTFKLDGNNLWLSGVENSNGKFPTPVTAKYVRVE
jgi:hypothetical protein